MYLTPSSGELETASDFMERDELILAPQRIHGARPTASNFWGLTALRMLGTPGAYQQFRLKVAEVDVGALTGASAEIKSLDSSFFDSSHDW